LIKPGRSEGGALIGLASCGSAIAGIAAAAPAAELLNPGLEIAAVVLLVAIVAAIALTLRHRKETKYQDPALQVKVQRKDRVRIVSMPAEKRQD